MSKNDACPSHSTPSLSLSIPAGAITFTPGPEDDLTRAASGGVTSGSQVTAQMIYDAMKDAPLATQQAGGVSLPRIQRCVDKLLAGEAASAINVDGRIIVDGNHRYIAGRILGKEPLIQKWDGGRPQRIIPWDKLPIDTEPWP